MITIRYIIIITILAFLHTKSFAQKREAKTVHFIFSYIYDSDSLSMYIDDTLVFKEVLISEPSTSLASSFEYPLVSGIHRLRIIVNQKETLFNLDVDKLPPLRWVEITKDGHKNLSLVIPEKMILRD